MWQKKKKKERKNRLVWLSCAWLHKREPILFFHRSTMPMIAISINKDCWDLEILLTWSHDATLLLSINQSRQAKSIIWAKENLKKNTSCGSQEREKERVPVMTTELLLTGQETTRDCSQNNKKWQGSSTDFSRTTGNCWQTRFALLAKISPTSCELRPLMLNNRENWTNLFKFRHRCFIQ